MGKQQKTQKKLGPKRRDPNTEGGTRKLLPVIRRRSTKLA